MNNVDVYIAVASTFFLVMGLRSGALRTFLSIAGVYLSAFISSGFSPIAISAFSILSVQESKAGEVVMFLVVFTVLYLIAEFMLSLSKSILSVSILGPLDKVIGGMLGAMKGLLIASIICSVLVTAPISDAMRQAIGLSTLRSMGDHLFRSTYPRAVSAVPVVQRYVSETVVPAVGRSGILPATGEAIVLIKAVPAATTEVIKPATEQAVKAVVEKINTLTNTASQ